MSEVKLTKMQLVSMVWLVIASFFLVWKFFIKNEVNLNVQNENDAVQFLEGTWTFTDPINTQIDSFPYKWTKWEISKNGTVKVYEADPIDNDWGKPEKCTYTVRTDKYSDTGERWYGISPCNYSITGIISGENIILRSPGYETSGTMKRGNKNPFSK